MTARCKCGGRITDPAHCEHGHAQPPSVAAALGAVMVELRDRIAALEASTRKLCELVAHMAAQVPEPGQLVDAHAVARLTGMSERWVYDHADELGAIRAGEGTRPRLRFDPAQVRARLDQRNGDGPEPPAAATPRLPEAPLLPVTDRAA